MSEQLTTQADQGDVLSSLFGYDAADLEMILVRLCRAGTPSLFRLSRGWMCSIKMHVAAAGSEFTIQSEFDCSSPIIAARQCTERIIATLNQWYQPRKGGEE